MRTLSSNRKPALPLVAAMMLMAPVIGLCATTSPELRIPSPTKVIWSASGVRNGGGLTTIAICSNRGSVAGTIGAQFFQYNGNSACLIGIGGVLPGETRTLEVGSVASMVDGTICSGGPAIDQGRVEIYANTAETLKFDCTILLVDKTNNPPLSMTRLKLYSGSGVPLNDIIFADGVDP